MSITVRLIFWGLMGFVPDPEGQKGMTTLLVDPEQIEAPCPVRHLSAVYLFEGECEGDCARIPADGESDAFSMGFQVKNGKLLDRDDQPLEMAWLLDREDLDISGDEDDRMKFQKPFLNWLRGKAPRSQRQTGYFDWIQSIDTLTGNRGRILPSCLRGESNCPLHARFRVQGGEASACHLFHEPEFGNPKDNKRNVRLFDYTTPNQEKFQRAVADAVQVTYRVQGDSVLLRSRRLPGRSEELDEGEAAEAAARIRPDSRGRLTLVVVNFPQDAGGGHDDPACHQPHSDFLYHLLDDPPAFRTVRDEGSQTTARAHPGACEPESEKLATLLRTSGEPPHSTTACDGGSIKK